MCGIIFLVITIFSSGEFKIMFSDKGFEKFDKKDHMLGNCKNSI